jgi:hypothetical protein
MVALVSVGPEPAVGTNPAVGPEEKGVSKTELESMAVTVLVELE